MHVARGRNATSHYAIANHYVDANPAAIGLLQPLKSHANAAGESLEPRNDVRTAIIPLHPTGTVRTAKEFLQPKENV